MKPVPDVSRKLFTSIQEDREGSGSSLFVFVVDNPLTLRKFKTSSHPASDSVVNYMKAQENRIALLSSEIMGLRNRLSNYEDAI